MDIYDESNNRLPKDRVIFLDRDGTINTDHGYIREPSQLELITGAGDALCLLGGAGYRIVVVTNQSGIARGIYSKENVNAIHDGLIRMLEPYGAKIDGIYYCPHHPSPGGGSEFAIPCDCRKPGLGLIRQAIQELALRVDWHESWIIGDKLSDVDMGRRLGCRSVLVRTGHGSDEEAVLAQSSFDGCYVCDDLLEAAGFIITLDLGSKR